MIKKLLLVIAAMTMLCVVGSAQDKAKDLLDKLSQTMNSYKSMDIKFSFTTNDEVNKTVDTKEGRVQAKGKAFKLTMDDMEVYSNGTAKWTVMDEVEEITVQQVDPNSSDMLDNPIKFLTVNNKDFKYTYKGTVNKAGKTLEEVEFYPKDKKAAYSMVKLQVEKGSLNPYTVSYIGKDATTYTVKVTSFLPNVSIDDKLLVFDQSKYKGYEVVDLR